MLSTGAPPFLARSSVICLGRPSSWPLLCSPCGPQSQNLLEYFFPDISPLRPYNGTERSETLLEAGKVQTPLLSAKPIPHAIPLAPLDILPLAAQLKTAQLTLQKNLIKPNLEHISEWGK